MVLFDIRTRYPGYARRGGISRANRDTRAFVALVARKCSKIEHLTDSEAEEESRLAKVGFGPDHNA
jgi:hypothetical protein